MNRALHLLPLLFLPFTVLANPIVIHHSHDFLWWWGISQGEIPLSYGLFTAMIGLSLEYVLLRTFLKHQIHHLGRKFIFINSLTFPLTQILAYYTGFLSELLPIISE